MRARNLLSMDFILLFPVLVLTIIGVMFIYSSGISAAGIQTSNEWTRQIVWGSAGLVLIIGLTLIDYKRIYGFALYFYLATLLMVAYTVFFGKLVNGARSWIGIGSFGIQPSEFAKITTIILLARYLDATKGNPASFKRFIVSCVIVFVPMVLILMQPDLGTSLVFIPILIVMTFIANVRLRYILFFIILIGLTGVLLVLPLWQSVILNNIFPPIQLLGNSRFILIVCGGLGVISVVALVGYLLYKKAYFFWIIYTLMAGVLSLGMSFVGRKILQEYQIMRLIVFLDPDVDPLGAGWHIIQSMTAIGSGGFMGRGFLQGTQSHYRYLPQQSTDFIFSIFSEEAGFAGGVIVFALFLIVNLRLIRIMRQSSDPFGLDYQACSPFTFSLTSVWRWASCLLRASRLSLCPMAARLCFRQWRA